MVSARETLSYTFDVGKFVVPPESLFMQRAGPGLQALSAGKLQYPDAPASTAMIMAPETMRPPFSVATRGENLIG
jgi:hypothetical protein